MEIKIKTATIENLKKVQELNLMLFEKENAEFDNTLNCKWTFGKNGTKYFTNRITKDDGCVFIALDGDKVVGYLACGLMNMKGSYRVLPNAAELENIFVLDEYRSMGVGTKLFQAFVGWSKSKGISRLRVIASASNMRAIDFYKKNGFSDYELILEKDL